MSEPLVAAYGLRFSGLQSRQWLAVEGAGHWPELEFSFDAPPEGPAFQLDVASRQVRFRSELSHPELVHPGLQQVCAPLALALGLDAIHGGAVAGRSGAWVLAGSKGAGKSTLLAALATAGSAVITDDVLIFGAGRALAGPRCLDLRPDAESFGAPLLAVRPESPRRRVTLPAVAAEHPLSGMIHLEWTARGPTLRRLPVREAMQRLAALQSERGWPRDARKLLDLLSLPAYVLARPRDWKALQWSAEAVGQLLDQAPAGSAAAPGPG